MLRRGPVAVINPEPKNDASKDDEERRFSRKRFTAYAERENRDVK
jgi:hypothetical protein